MLKLNTWQQKTRQSTRITRICNSVASWGIHSSSGGWRLEQYWRCNMSIWFYTIIWTLYTHELRQKRMCFFCIRKSSYYVLPHSVKIIHILRTSCSGIYYLMILLLFLPAPSVSYSEFTTLMPSLIWGFNEEMLYYLKGTWCHYVNGTKYCYYTIDANQALLWTIIDIELLHGNDKICFMWYQCTT
jgi:hypothetical protein